MKNIRLTSNYTEALGPLAFDYSVDYEKFEDIQDYASEAE